MRRLLIAVTVLVGLPLVGVVVVTSAGAQLLVVPTDSSSEPGPDPDPDPDTSEPFFPTFEVVSARLVSRGAAVDIQYTVTCDLQALFRVHVTQRRGSRLVESAEGLTLVSCTGEPQTVTVRANVATTRARFNRGEAVVDTRFDWEDLFPLLSTDNIRLS